MTRLKTCSNDTAPINHYRATAENDMSGPVTMATHFRLCTGDQGTLCFHFFFLPGSLSLSLSLSLSESLSAFGGCGRPVRICRAPAKLSAPIDFHLIHCASFGAD